MKITLRHKGHTYTCTPSGDHVTVGGLTCCGETLRARGVDCHTVDDRRYEARALAVCCGVEVGTIVAEPSTIFGIEEDRRVMNARCRVY